MNGDYNRAESLIENNGVAGADSRKRRFLKTLIFSVTGLALFAYLCFTGQHETTEPAFTDDLNLSALIRKTDGTCRRIGVPNRGIFLILDGKAHHILNPTVMDNLFSSWAFEDISTLPYPEGEVFGEATRLVTYPGDPAVYLSVNGKVLREIASVDTKNACNFNYGRIIQAPAVLPKSFRIDAFVIECKVYYVPSKTTASSIGVYIVAGNIIRQFGSEADWGNIMTYGYKTLPALPSLPTMNLRQGYPLSGVSL
jgi:hypothetical protein